MHGGAGGIMSIGLMRAVSLEFMERCTQSLYSTGGDAFISICLWQVRGRCRAAGSSRAF